MRALDRRLVLLSLLPSLLIGGGWACPAPKRACPACADARVCAAPKEKVCPSPLKPKLPRFGFTVSAPAAEGLDGAAVQRMIARAEQEKSSALILLKNGKLVLERYFEGGPEPRITMSIAKSITALAIGQLIAAKKIRSIDTKLAELLPKLWPQQGEKSAITLRQLLNHTSGLSPRRAHRTRGRLARHARRTPVVTPPGTRFYYNNNATDLLALIVHRVTGAYLDDYLQAKLFGPLEVVGNFWLKYADGHPRVAGELFIRPIDLARIGQMLLQGGKWRGRQLVSRRWIKRLIAPGQKLYPECGLLWWREARFKARLTDKILADWLANDVPQELCDKAKQALSPRVFYDDDAFHLALRRALSADELKTLKRAARQHSLLMYEQVQAGRQLGYSARGSYGQYLVVVPSARLVAVRMRTPTKDDYRRGDHQLYKYKAFRDDVLELAGRPRNPRRRRHR